MRSKLYRLFEYAYLVMSALSIYMVITNWGENRNRAYLFAFFAVLGVAMFFFKRRFRKMVEENYKD